MKDRELYTVILGLSSPWRVVDVEVSTEKSEIVVKVDHNRSVSLECPTCAKTCPGYDHSVRRWRHLDTCQFMTILECSVPRVKCSEHGVLTVRVPWSEARSRFTALMEAHIIDWLHEASHSGIARVTGLSWDEISVIMKNAVQRGLERRGSIAATRIGVDEKCRSKRTDYVTIVVDHEEGGVLHVADGRGKESLAGYFRAIGPEACEKIEIVTMDMSAAYIATTKEYVPEADNKICIDRFHVAQHISKAVDQVRRQENKDLVFNGDDRLKQTKFLWIKNIENQTAENLARFRKLEKTSLVTAKAWRVKEIARHLWDKRPRMNALFDWTAWCIKAVATKLAPMVRVAETVRRHIWNIANAIFFGTSNAKSESYNAAVQKVATRAHGFHNNDNFKAAIYFHLGRLKLYPTGVIRP